MKEKEDFPIPHKMFDDFDSIPKDWRGLDGLARLEKLDTLERGNWAEGGGRVDVECLTVFRSIRKIPPF